MRPTNFSPAFLLIFLTFKIASAQTDLDSALIRTEKTESKLTFGVQLFQGLEFYRYDCGRETFRSGSEYTLMLGTHANYRWNASHAMQTEVNVKGSNGLSIATNIQYEYFFTKRWSVYGGLGIDLNVDQSTDYLGYPKQRHLIPQAMVGVRYKASKWITLDLRYTRDLMDRYKDLGDFQYPVISRTNNMMLGIQVNF